MQVDWSYCHGTKSKGKRIEKMIALKRLYKIKNRLKTDLLKSVGVKIIFVNIYGLCRN